jgi:hypothetical protein
VFYIILQKQKKKKKKNKKKKKKKKKKKWGVGVPYPGGYQQTLTIFIRKHVDKIYDIVNKGTLFSFNRMACTAI